MMDTVVATEGAEGRVGTTKQAATAVASWHRPCAEDQNGS